jgi:ribonuclease HI
LIYSPIDKIGAWGYFDGASQCILKMSGARGIIHLSESQRIVFKVALQEGSNNYVELLNLKILLKLAMQNGASKIQVFKNSLIVISLMMRKSRMEILALNTL